MHWNSAVELYSSLGDCEATGNVFFEMFEGLLWAGREQQAAEIAQRGLAGLRKTAAAGCICWARWASSIA